MRKGYVFDYRKAKPNRFAKRSRLVDLSQSGVTPVAKKKVRPDLTAWLTRICAAERPPKSVVAYNVGLFETEGGYSAYLIGADEYDPDDGDWACDEAFTPAERYCPIPAEGFKGWEEVHAAVVAEVKAYLASAAGRKSFLASAEAVTVGFDDGDLERVR